MDYPLHYTENNSLQDKSSNNTGTTNNYRSFGGVFNDRSDISSIMFDNNSSVSPTIDSLEVNEDRSRSMLLMSTRPPSSQVMHDPWNQQHQQLPHSMSSHEFNPHDIHSLSHHHHHQQQHHQHQHHLHNISHSERGIAGFVSKLYQCLQSTDTSQKYARWCQHDGKDMFIIDCIPEFTEVVLPRLFKHCKFPSFVRQLNIYGFQRDTDARKSKDTKDKESCRWYHPCFRPGRRDLFHLIRRKATRYSRKKRVKTEEDPETILNLGSDNESEIDEDNVVLLIREDNNNNNNNNNRRCSSSASSMHQQSIDYNTAPSQLQLGFNNESATNATINSPNILNQHHPMSLAEPAAITATANANTNVTANTTATANTNTTNTTTHTNHTNHITHTTTDESSNNTNDRIIHPDIVVMRDQELRLQIYHMKRQYERMHGYFEEQLNSAQIQIEEQKIRIQQLEGALRLTKPSSVKLNNNGYMSTVCTTIPNNNNTSSFNGNFLSSNPSAIARIVNHQHRSLYDSSSNNNNSPSISSSSSSSTANNTNITTTPRPTAGTNQFYFNENKVKTENNDNESSWSTTSFNNNQHHRDTMDKSTTNGIVAAGSNTTENSTIIETTDKLNITSSSPLILHRTSKGTLSNHLNYNSYI